MLLHMKGVFGPLGTEEGGGKRAGVTPLLVAGKGAVGLWVNVGNEGEVDQHVTEGRVPVEGGQGRGGEYVSGGGISLEMMKMASDNLLDVDA
eukprot:g41051.t1